MAARTSRWIIRSCFFIIVLALVATVMRVKDISTPESILAPHPSSSRSKPRIAIVTFTTHQTSYTHLSLKNKNAYARLHGYDLLVDFEATEPRGNVWYKFVMLERAITSKKYDWIWWIDFDTLITNSTIALSDIISESLANKTAAVSDKIDFLFTADCFPFNAGSMLVRSRTSSIDFLNKVRAYGDTHADMSEQDSVRDVIDEGSAAVKQQALWIPQWKMNAFPEEIACFDESKRGWEKGLFVVHFAGAWAHVKEEDPTGYLMRKYEREIL